MVQELFKNIYSIHTLTDYSQEQYSQIIIKSVDEAERCSDSS